MIISGGKKYRLYKNGKEYKIPNFSGVFNTYIGGIGGVINTKLKLANRLGILESNITDLYIQGLNISCFINTNYEINTYFANNNGGSGDWGFGDLLTYFIDVDGLITSTNPTLFDGQTGFNFFQSKNIINFNGGFSFRNTDVSEIYQPNTTELLTSSVFRGMSSADSIYLPNCIAYLNNTAVNQIFIDIKTGCDIYIDPSMLTVDGGNLEPDLLYAKNSRGANIIPVLNQNPSNPITDLSVINVGGNDWQFNFTTPGSTNTIKNYRVFAFNGTILSRYKYNDTILNSGGVLTLPSNTSSVWIQVADQYLNLSDNSNIVKL